VNSAVLIITPTRLLHSDGVVHSVHFHGRDCTYFKRIPDSIGEPKFTTSNLLNVCHLTKLPYLQKNMDPNPAPTEGTQGVRDAMWCLLPISAES
jgi:hypothetical protein